ncbi:MAG: 6-phosphogluconolactonase [Thermoplasmata archaeon]
MRVYSDLSAASAALARHLADRARAAVRERGAFSLVLAGGKTPEGLYELLARRYRKTFPWARTEVFFGDERCVPPRDPRSNYASVRTTLFDRVPIPPERIHRIPGEIRPPSRAAARYARLLRGTVPPAARDLPRFDVVLLGLGPDGHTAALFPGAAALAERRRFAVSVQRAGRPPYVPRITLTLPALASSREICFLAAGPEKAPAVAAALRPRGRGDPRFPASLVRSAGPVWWYIDRAAAALLPERRGTA